DRAYTQQVEIVRGRKHAPHANRFAFSRQAQCRNAGGGKADEALLPVAHRFEIGIREGKRKRVAAPKHQSDDFLRAGQAGDRIEQSGINPSKNRGIRADAQRERQHGDRRIPRGLCNHSQAVTNVLPKGVHPRTSWDTFRADKSKSKPKRTRAPMTWNTLSTAIRFHQHLASTAARPFLGWTSAAPDSKPARRNWPESEREVLWYWHRLNRGPIDAVGLTAQNYVGFEAHTAAGSNAHPP